MHSLTKWRDGASIICFSCFFPYMAVSEASEMTNRLFRALQFRVNRKQHSTRKWSQNKKKKIQMHSLCSLPCLLLLTGQKCIIWSNFSAWLMGRLSCDSWAVDRRGCTCRGWKEENISSHDGCRKELIVLKLQTDGVLAFKITRCNTATF